MPWAGLEPACLAAGDFKSPVATNYTTGAFVVSREDSNLYRVWYVTYAAYYTT